MMKKAFLLTTMLLVVMLTFAGCGEDNDKDGRLIGNDSNQQSSTQDAEDGRNGVIDDTERVGDDIRDDVDDAVDDVKDAVTGDDDNKDSKDKNDMKKADDSKNKDGNNNAAENRNTTGQ